MHAMAHFDEDTLAAASSMLKCLATNSSIDSSRINGPINLPGPTTAGKLQLEHELSGLVNRVLRLEQKATVLNHQALPITPSETGAPSGFAEVVTGGQKKGTPTRQQLVNSLANSREAPLDERPQKVARVAGDTPRPEVLEERVLDQAAQIQQAKEANEGLEQKLLDFILEQEKKNRQELERVLTLERELRKHQQANEAFQKALREIGEIVTAVAKGDLSKKVLIHAIELDPEITVFKRVSITILILHPTHH